MVDRIYQAAVKMDEWPIVLQDIADRLGAKGAHFLWRSKNAVDAVASPAIERDVADFFAEGWGERSQHAAALLAEAAPAFRAEVDYHSADAIAAMPVHKEFLDPRGFIAGVGTVVQGAGDIMIQLAIEGFQSHESARRSLSWLDSLRPDLARALTLTSLRRSQSQIVVDSLALAGVGAAIVSREGALGAANERFISRLGDQMLEIGGRLRFTDRFFHARLIEALRHHASAKQMASLPLAGQAGQKPFVIHLISISGKAREFCDAEGVLLILSEAANESVPDADLLRTLFDLTPAESRLARSLMSGASLDEAAVDLNVKKHTARTQLRSVFAKTGASRQAELVLLLAGLGKPT